MREQVFRDFERLNSRKRHHYHHHTLKVSQQDSICRLPEPSIVPGHVVIIDRDDDVRRFATKSHGKLN